MTLLYERMRDRVTEELRRHMRPELLNRIDEIIVFHALNREQITRIVDLLLKRTAKSLAERNMTLEVTDRAKAILGEHGFDPLYGARPLRRTIQRLLENPISSGILRREYKEGDTVLVDADDSGRIVPRLLAPGSPTGARSDEVLTA